MASFDDFVSEAQPCAMVARDEATEGKSWEFYAGAFLCLDDDGEYTEVSLAGCTAEWKILSELDGSTVLTLTTAITADNQVKGTATPSQTAGLGGTSQRGRRCPWYLTVTNPSGRKVCIFDPQDSVLVIKQGV